MRDRRANGALRRKMPKRLFFTLLKANGSQAARQELSPESRSFRYAVPESGLYTVRVTAERGEGENLSVEQKLAVSAGELQAAVSTASRLLLRWRYGRFCPERSGRRCTAQTQCDDLAGRRKPAGRRQLDGKRAARHRPAGRVEPVSSADGDGRLRRPGRSGSGSSLRCTYDGNSAGDWGSDVCVRALQSPAAGRTICWPLPEPSWALGKARQISLWTEKRPAEGLHAVWPLVWVRIRSDWCAMHVSLLPALCWRASKRVPAGRAGCGSPG